MKQLEIVRVQGEPSRRTLRFLFSMGHTLLIVLLATWALFLYYLGPPYDKTFVTAVLQLFGGRAVGVGYGFKQGLSPLFMFFQVAMVDFILMLYIYPVFVRGYQHLTRIPVVGSYLSNIHKAALSHKKRMAPYGAVGLIAFVVFPFWSTGCVVGAVVGYLIGLPTWLSLSSVSAGNIAAITAWILFYEKLIQWNENVAHIFLLLVLLLAVAGFIIARVRAASRKKEESLESAVEVETTAPETHVSNDVCAEGNGHIGLTPEERSEAPEQGNKGRDCHDENHP